MGKILREIEYEELSEVLQNYLDKGETKEALEYCEVAAQAGNPYGYMFMAFIYEEGHGSVEIDYKKALCYYKEAERLGCEVKQDVVRLEQLLYRIEQRILNDFENL
ncbi:MAG: sel1 repeat family protein [Agathobacter sp.]|nr:sel1 repeat family protein [Agathobacter sp.]